MSDVTSEMISKVAAWCREHDLESFETLDFYALCRQHDRLGSAPGDWVIVGAIAEAAKKADAEENPMMVFHTPWWFGDDGVWMCRISIFPFMPEDVFTGSSISPASAAILAVSAYLETRKDSA